MGNNDSLQLGPYTYNKKWQNSFFMKVVKRILIRITLLYDWFWDHRICHCSLVKYVPSLYRQTLGATGSQSSPYWVLDEMFKDFHPTANDNIVDVGCGKGRVLAYLIREKCPCSITGIELNADVASYANQWISRYPNAKVEHANAFDLNFDQYTVMFLFRPFEPDFFAKFLDKLDAEITHPLKVFYFADTQSGYMLKDRPGWTKLRRQWVWRKYGLYMYPCPQRFSEWTFTPVAK